MTNEMKQLIDYINKLPMTEHNFYMLKECAKSQLHSNASDMFEDKPTHFCGVDIREKKDIIHNEIHNSNIGMKFQEEAINQMYDEQDDYHTGF